MVTYGANGFVRVEYVTNGHNHFHKFWVKVVDPSPFGSPTLETQGGTDTAVGTAVNTWATAFASMLPTTGGTLVGYEVYSQPTLASDPVPIWADDLTNAGTVNGTPTANGQAIGSWRTALGSFGKVTVLETVMTVNQRLAWRAGQPTLFGTFRTYLVGSTNIVCGFDGGYPVGTLYFTTKINDVLRKRYVLDN